MPKTILKVSIDTDNSIMLDDLVKQSGYTKSDLVNLLLYDFFNLTNRMGLIRDIIVGHELTKINNKSN